MPVGAYCGSAAVMSKISPDGEVYQAGTLSGNPVAMAAGIAQLTECLKPGFYKKLEEKTIAFTNALNDYAEAKHYLFRVFSIGSIFWFAFTGSASIKSAKDIDPESMNSFARFYHLLLERGIYMGPSGYEVGFISEAHTKKILHETRNLIMECLDIIRPSKPRADRRVSG